MEAICLKQDYVIKGHKSFATQADHPQSIFSYVVIYFCPAIVCIVRKGGHWFTAYANAFASSECRDSVFIFSRSQLSRDVRSGFAFS